MASVSDGAIFTPELLSDFNCIGFFVSRQSVYQARLCGPAAACNECTAKIPKWRRWFVKGGDGERAGGGRGGGVGEGKLDRAQCENQPA